MKTFIHRKYTVDIDRIQICTKDKKKNNNTQYTLQRYDTIRDAILTCARKPT